MDSNTSELAEMTPGQLAAQIKHQVEHLNHLFKQTGNYNIQIDLDINPFEHRNGYRIPILTVDLSLKL